MGVTDRRNLSGGFLGHKKGTSNPESEIKNTLHTPSSEAARWGEKNTPPRPCSVELQASPVAPFAKKNIINVKKRWLDLLCVKK